MEFTKLFRRKPAVAKEEEPKPLIVDMGEDYSNRLLVGDSSKKKDDDHSDNNDGDDNAKLGKKGPSVLLSAIGSCMLQFTVIVATVILLARLGATDPNQGLDALIDQSYKSFDSVVKSGLDGLGIGRVDPNVHLNMDFTAGTEAETISLGPHTARVKFDEGCTSPHFWMRLEGEALVGVNLTEDEAEDGALSWKGTFYLPRPGIYRLVGHWYGCYGGGGASKLIEVPDIKATGSAIPSMNTNPMFPQAAWMYDSEIKKYVWTNPNIGIEKSHIRESRSVVFTDEGTLDDNGVYDLTSLDRNDQICWVGSVSAQILYTAFLEIRKVVAARLKTKNFLYFPVNTLDGKPDALWKRDQKANFKKCKQIFVSIDDFRYPVTQYEYKMQIENFLEHLTRAFPDENIPIWMMSMIESPEERRNCYDSHLPTSSIHPCNMALKELFEDIDPFEPRVRLLDNTDLTLPQLGDSKKQTATVIALRSAVLIGKQKQEWTKAGLRSTERGWLRGDQAINSVDLVPYTEWSL